MGVDFQSVASLMRLFGADSDKEAASEFIGNYMADPGKYDEMGNMLGYLKNLYGSDYKHMDPVGLTKILNNMIITKGVPVRDFIHS